MDKAKRFPCFAVPLLLFRREELKTEVDKLRVGVSTLLQTYEADQVVVCQGLLSLQEAEKVLKNLDDLIYNELGLRL